jgi:hypothetical protein
MAVQWGAEPVTAPAAPSAPVVTPPSAGNGAARSADGFRWLPAAAWAAGIVVIFAFFVRIALSLQVDSDGANNALQAWDMLHSNILLHQWIIGDATYYTFDLPVLVFTESLFGLTVVSMHVAAAITYLILTVLAMALARTGSRGAASAARCAVVVAVMTATFVIPGGIWIVLAKPDHVGTGVFLLASFALIDRAPRRAFTPPLLFLILCAGQLGDALVLYVAVPTIILVSLYRAIAARSLRTGDLLAAAAAAASVPATGQIRAGLVHLGGYLMVAPRTQLAARSVLAQHASLTLRSIGNLFGVIPAPGSLLGPVSPVLGWVALLVALTGLIRVVATWRRAGTAEQMLAVAIVVNVGAYIFSTLPTSTNPREIAFLVPAGAVLGARALVPAVIPGARRAALALAAAMTVALVPLTAAATTPTATAAQAPLVSWLEAHGLRYGISGYWDASDLTVVSGGDVRVRAVKPWHGHLAELDWETKTSWYDRYRYTATFAIAGVGAPTNSNVTASQFETYLGRPVAIYTLGKRQILVYDYNLLRRVRPGLT